ncbi:MSMEG_4193 family putative phosphomutase [Enemella sp. A6]|uniref:MSMEG_4193 family putative phosphomutase n=1 Tax=Enemella sp. A6 TaxID=3440152 RepID=UPI003EC0231F
MTTLVLVRHGRTTANANHVLAGRSPGVHLDEVGVEQARTVGRRLAGVPVSAVFSSPMERCLQTAAVIGEQVDLPPATAVEALTECDYGAWTGSTLKDLAAEALWQVVQQNPSEAAFPDGESLSEMSTRAVNWVRATNRHLATAQGADAVWLAVSHGDVIKAIVADALGIHLDQFQRIMVDPGSVTVIRYTPARPFVVCVNTTSGELAPVCAGGAAAAQVGGGLGSGD